MARMMRKNYCIQPGRVEGHGHWCDSCKPDEWRGRAAEKCEWKRQTEDA
jgi:hypothetical protein